MDNNSSNNPNQPSSPFPPTPDPVDVPTPDPNAGAPLPDPMSIAGTPPIEPAAQAPSGWLAATDQTNAPVAPVAPVADLGQPAAVAPAQPLDTNPFLQQSPAAPTMPEAPTAPPLPVTPTDPAQLGVISPVQDPLNTAFAPVADPNQVSPFGAPPAPTAVPPPIPGLEQPGQLPAPDLPDFLNPEAAAAPPNPVVNMAEGSNQIQNSDETANQAMSSETSFGQSGSASSPSGTIDLSAVLSSDTPNTNSPIASGAPIPMSPPTGAGLPETGPVENAPTDLSHLIAGEGEHNAPGDIYTPPVAQDQNPSINQPQVPSQTGTDGAPPEKHLNLTKVLLVAGIPILLIVAALSAYLILGIGKPAASPEPTPLPIEQTQAPLTNPPQQIADPSPATLPSPSTSAVFAMPESSGSANLPGASASPLSALEQLRARSSASPAASGSPTTIN